MKGKSFISVSLLESIYMEQNGKDGVIHRKSLNLHVYTEYKAKSEFIQF